MNQPLTLSSLSDPREETYFGFALVFSILVWIVCVVTIIPILYVLGISLFVWLGNGLLIASLKAEAVKVDTTQFPALAQACVRVCAKLGVTPVPDLYVAQSGGMLNAFATRHCGRNFVVLYSEILETYGADSPEIEFLIGHEIGHIRRSHLQKRILLFPGLLLPLLGNAYHRACERSSDRHGSFAARDAAGAVRAMMILAGGKQARETMSPELFARQYMEQRGFFVSWYELISGYPTLSQRVAHLIALQNGGTPPRAPRNFWAYLFAFFTFGGAGGGGANAMVTVCVIAMLAAVAMPAMITAREKAQARSAELALQAEEEEDGASESSEDENVPEPQRCLNQLRMIADAKEAVIMEQRLSDTSAVPRAAVEDQLHGSLPRCPQGGVYSINLGNQRPSCSIHGDRYAGAVD